LTIARDESSNNLYWEEEDQQRGKRRKREKILDPSIQKGLIWRKGRRSQTLSDSSLWEKKRLILVERDKSRGKNRCQEYTNCAMGLRRDHQGRETSEMRKGSHLLY